MGTILWRQYSRFAFSLATRASKWRPLTLTAAFSRPVLRIVYDMFPSMKYSYEQNQQINKLCRSNCLNCAALLSVWRRIPAFDELGWENVRSSHWFLQTRWGCPPPVGDCFPCDFRIGRPIGAQLSGDRRESPRCRSRALQATQREWRQIDTSGAIALAALWHEWHECHRGH